METIALVRKVASFSLTEGGLLSSFVAMAGWGCWQGEACMQPSCMILKKAVQCWNSVAVSGPSTNLTLSNANIACQTCLQRPSIPPKSWPNLPYEQHQHSQHPSVGPAQLASKGECSATTCACSYRCISTRASETAAASTVTAWEPER